VQEAQANITKLEAPVELSGDTPFKPNTGKTLGILNCGAQIPLCNEMTKNAADAATALGWKSFSVDGKLSPSGWNSAMMQLIAKKPDLILSTIAQDSAMPTAMAAAKQAGIPVVCSYCANTDQKPTADPSMANADNDYGAQGRAAADYIIAKSDGKAKVAIMTFNLSIAPSARVKAFEARMKECTGCEVLTSVEIGATSDPAGTTRGKAQAILSKYPKGELDWIVSPADTYTVGVTQAVKLSGRDDVKVIGYDCDPPAAVNDIRSGSADQACVHSSVYPSVWAGIDQLARIDADQPHRNVKLPFQLITKDNAPPEGQPVGGSDFPEYYKKLWGVG
jgi:ribose transport system substrate-binding protein